MYDLRTPVSSNLTLEMILEVSRMLLKASTRPKLMHTTQLELVSYMAEKIYSL
jgi:hypothetical protein